MGDMTNTTHWTLALLAVAFVALLVLRLITN